MRTGIKSAAQTKAPIKDRIKGSKVNKKGSASSTARASSILLSDKITSALSKKAQDFNEKYKGKKVSVTTLKAVFRRGAGAFSTSHRPNMTRNGWAYARVNKFLEKKAGKTVKAAYVQDDDLMEKGGELGQNIQCINCGWEWNTKDSEEYDKYVCHKCGFDNSLFYSNEIMSEGGLLAANGKPSKLTPEQYRLVRTPEFKAWFGDWENDPENASEVVDENGEPMVVYRGDSSASKRGTVFKTGYNRLGFIDKERLANEYFFYFVDNYDVAVGYANDQIENHNDKIERGEITGKPWQPKVTSYFLNIRKTIDITPNNPLFISYEDYKKMELKKSRDLVNDRNYHIPKSYGEYITRKNLHEIFTSYMGDYFNQKEISEYTQNSLKKRMNSDAEDKLIWSYFVEYKYSDSTVLWAIYNAFVNNKVDGLKFIERTNFDAHDFKEGDFELLNQNKLKFDYKRWKEKPIVYAALYPEQIKLADGTNTTFDMKNPDIRYAEGGRTSKPAWTVVGVYPDEANNWRSESEDLTKEGLIGYRIRYNKEPNYGFGYTRFNPDELEMAKKYEEEYNIKAEEDKQAKKIRDAENKIKREQQKKEDEIKLQAAQQEIVKKPAYLMEEAEYQSKVVPLLKEYEKFVKKNDQYLASIDFDPFIYVTFEEALEKNLQGKQLGYNFQLVGGKYDGDMTQEQKTIQSWNYKKFRNFEEKEAPKPTPLDVIEKNKEFLNKFSNYFSEDLIYKGLNKSISKSNKWNVKLAIEDDTYKKLLEDDDLSENELEKIASSVDVKVPKKVFSKENVKAKETQALLQKLLKDVPTINIDKLQELIESIKTDFKPIEEETFLMEKTRYTKIIEILLSKDKAYETFKNKFYDISLSAISIWDSIFDYDNRLFDEVKTGQYRYGFRGTQGAEIVETNYYVTGLKLKSDWESKLDKFIKAYVDTLKYKFIDAIIKNFSRVSKPISSFEKIYIEVGAKGFEGVYRFNFEDRSHFNFKAEAIPAGGYNIQAFHYRYITNFEDITLADGSKVKGYYSIVENFSSKKMAHGGQINKNLDMNLTESLSVSDIDNKYPNVSHKYINKQVLHGIKVEMEHTSDPEVAKKIALDHLNESIHYYEELEKMEKRLERMDMDEHFDQIKDSYAEGGEIEEIFVFETPSGERSKLNYIQQVLIRTSAFKKWFGDWELAGRRFIKDNKENFEKHYEEVSKVIDYQTLEPRVVFHGTRTQEEFYTFDVTREKGEGRPYAYFAHNKEYAQHFTTTSQRGSGSNPFFYECFLNVKKPFMAIGHDFVDKDRDANGWLLSIVGQILWDKYKRIEKDDFSKALETTVDSQIGRYVNSVYPTDTKSKFWKLMAFDREKNFKFFLIAYGYDGVFYTEEFSRDYDVDNPAQFTQAVTIFDAREVKLADGRNTQFDPFIDDIRFEKGGDVNEKDSIKIENDHIENENQHNMNKLELLEQMMEKGGKVYGDKNAPHDAKKGGFFEGKSHAEGGIKAKNVDTGQIIEVEGNEVIINKKSVGDETLREFEGEMLTNRQILSKINEDGGGVAFEDGGEVKYNCNSIGKKYNFGGELLDNNAIVSKINENNPVSVSKSYLENIMKNIYV